MQIDVLMNNYHSRPTRRKLNHSTPFWIRESREQFFITICCRKRGGNTLANAPVAYELIETVRYRNVNGIWWCSAFVVMPDHVHGIMRFSENSSMADVIRNWKAWTAKRLGIRWQKNWFDHRIRADESRKEKAQYIFHNPVRAGLVEEAHRWPYSFFELP